MSTRINIKFQLELPWPLVNNNQYLWINQGNMIVLLKRKFYCYEWIFEMENSFKQGGIISLTNLHFDFNYPLAFVLRRLAIVEGMDAFEDNIAEEVAKRIEDEE